MKNLPARLDGASFLDTHVWDFGWHSLLRGYARLFVRKVIFRHPIRSFRGFRRYRQFVKGEKDLLRQYERSVVIPDEPSFLKKLEEGQKPLVGLGFCLKPHDPSNPAASCPSGRPNHDCAFMETGVPRPACASCFIHDVARKCLESGCAAYVMTSAHDIAEDLFFPQINAGRFPSALLLLCPYSIQAILPALFICGMSAVLLAYSSGSCLDYRDWIRADRGDKESRTTVSEEAKEKIFELLEKAADGTPPHRRFERRGNVFWPTD